jgi:hypothetical protein
METQTTYRSATPEQTVVQIMRKLPPERVLELVDFARFLEFRGTEHYYDWVETRSEQTAAAEQRWDELLARPEAKQLMRQMAREAQADYHAGRTTEIVETEDGRLAPG